SRRRRRAGTPRSPSSPSTTPYGGSGDRGRCRRCRRRPWGDLTFPAPSGYPFTAERRLCPMSGTMVFIPAWNEEASLPAVIQDARAELPDADVLAIDDGSTD